MNKKKGWFFFSAFVIAVVLIVTLTLFLRPSHKCNSKAAVAAGRSICSETLSDKCYSKAAVAADARKCSEIGRDMLKGGGTAVDAAIATLLCLSLFNPQSMGIGGGLVFTIYNASTGNVETINARETAPMKASQNMFGNKQECTKASKGLCIAVPGELRGYEMAHKRHGRLPWKELFEPSINLAKDGIRIGKALAKAIQNNEGKIKNNAALCEMFCGCVENDTRNLSKLARTYETISEEGAKAFYNGSLTDAILKDIKDAGGIITRGDLTGYKAVLNEHAFNFTLRNYTFYAPTAPFGGPVLALILNILEGYNFTNSSVSTKNKTIKEYHRMIEAFHFADVEKNKLGDPRDEKITKVVLQIVKDMTSVKFASDIMKKINDSIKQDIYHGSNGDVDSGTSHLSIIDEYGNAVAVTSSINDYFGSGVMSNSTGIIFNDVMDDFSFSNMTNGVNKNNLIEPGKRPLSSMCPTIIFDQHKKVKMVVGGEGGTNITTATAQVIMNYLFFGYDLHKAVKEPRVQIRGNKTVVEKDFDEGVIKGLEQKGHKINNTSEMSVIQAIVREGDTLCAESDERKYGYPAGY